MFTLLILVDLITINVQSVLSYVRGHGACPTFVMKFRLLLVSKIFIF